jgi:hypothetical protein
MTGSKADGINIGEITSDTQRLIEGAEPVYFTRPKRKRGYHRALKSGKPWALSKKSWSDILNTLHAGIMEDYILTDNPLLKLARQSVEQGIVSLQPTSYLKKSLWSRIKSFLKR